MSTTLDCLSPGVTATITVTSGSDADLLRAMGLREGTDVTVRRIGEPCIVESGNTRLGLARCVTSNVHVTPHG
ncbi:MAG: FeoA family protein [Phycisphaerales bacterium]|nr:FeoA family protein [Phycisphaerales bacterium]